MASTPKKKAPRALLAGALLTPRERLWNTMRQLRRFTALELQDACMPLVTMPTAKRYVQSLAKAGFLRVLAGKRQGATGPYQWAIYEVAKDQLEAPRVRDGGKLCTEGMKQLAIWRAMQTLKTYEIEELHRAVNLPATADRPAFEVSRRSVEVYHQALLRSAHITVHKVGATPASGGRLPNVYRLVKNTGALPPMVTRTLAVVDRNLGDMRLVETMQEVVDANA